MSYGSRWENMRWISNDQRIPAPVVRFKGDDTGDDSKEGDEVSLVPLSHYVPVSKDPTKLQRCSV
jgi:hypothetical protein